jgi:septal ring factor EnvC (AmiA/AmiB activator)
VAKEHSHLPEMDLDSTDRLPILDGGSFDHDVEDDSVPLDHTAVLPGPSLSATSMPDFVRPSGVDLPSLAESVRSVEERISRQHTEYEALSRAFDRARDAESAAVTRANALAADLAAARAALESERDTLAARDTTIVQVLHSLGERDAQLTALQTEHARLVPVLEATSKSTSQLNAELQSARAKADALAAELQAAQKTAAELRVQVERSESELDAVRSELGAAKTQASSYLDLLRTREWRRGFDQNLFRELDAKVGAAHAGHGALESERDRLQRQVAALEVDGMAQSATVEAEKSRLTAELAARDRALAEAGERAGGAARRVTELLEAAERQQAEMATQTAQMRSEQAVQIARLQAEAETHEQEMAVLMAHLQEARRPIQLIEADITRLTEELAAKGAACSESDEENRQLRATLERTRGALEEREFLIRRLERSESNNANALGRIQTSIERLGSAPGSAGAGVAAPVAEWSAELIRIDGERPVTHVLARRTRIGRAAGCELQIDSSSVSRHHALILVGPRDATIEDLNSTNGILVNGRKVTRQLLCDGDAVTIGETQFRYLARPLHPSAEPNLAAPDTMT